MQAATEELLGLRSDLAIQLTPGCAPTEGFSRWLADQGVIGRTHHGFSWHALRRSVWCKQSGELLVRAHSVHPPKAATLAGSTFWAQATRHSETGIAFEIMYPGYVLGTGAELERAMKMGIRLAVDVSHLFIQWTAGTLRSSTLERVLQYPHIEEVHVSANDGTHDQHRPITKSTFGLDWAREMLMENVPVIIESYLHTQSNEQRHEQLGLMAA
jgi:endonuclease IV